METNSSSSETAHPTAASPGIDRRDALALSLSGLGAAAFLGLATGATEAKAQGGLDAPRPGTIGNVAPPPLAIPGWNAEKSQFELAPLPYAANALEPHIDAQTMEIHHGKHHAAYVNGLNKALAELARIRDGQGDAALVKHWSREVSFHGAGHVNHAMFWLMMAPAGKGGGGQPTGELAKAIDRDFGSFDRFVAHYKAAANQVEGGGWAWLVLDQLSNRLMIIQGEKQQDLMVTGATPILGLDVWEHAYYLKYQNKRADYVNAWFNVVNWPFVQRLFDQAMKRA
jgi:Fe-Mn family superoxide dismutase